MISEVLLAERDQVDSPRPRKVLLVDDDPVQLKLTGLRLRDAGFDVDTATNAHDALQKARVQRPDAIVSDVLMGGLDGFGFCRRLRAEPTLEDVPVVLLSAHYQGEPDQHLARRVGASALVARTPDFNRELEALTRALGDRCRVSAESLSPSLFEEHLRTNANQIMKLLGRVRTAEERYRVLFENASDPVAVLSADGIILEVNARWGEVLGVRPAAAVGRHVRELSPPGREADFMRRCLRATASGGSRADRIELRRSDDTLVHMEFSASLVELDGTEVVFAIGRDVTDQVQAERALAAAEHRYRSLIERLPDVIWTATVDSKLVFITPNARDVLGYSAEEMCALDLSQRASALAPGDEARVMAAFQHFVETGVPFDLEYRRRHKDGRWIWVRNRAIASYEREGVRYIEGMLSDVTERRQLEESLRQAQKMEAVGQLTGGIAHDFNNILSTILAGSHFLIEALGENDPRLADAEEIRVAAERAASLTRQLLAFSRRQVLKPTVADLNTVVTGVDKMLRRLIGEDLEVSVVLDATIGSVQVDVGQIEQVLMNLVVNARDAMPNGGRLEVETADRDFDESEAAQLSLPPGRYVMLAVSDTGCGMDAATRERIFEPFFTTKELGRGTGLGLSTVYGIVKQSGGHICVQSELGRGTVFRIYLPCVDAEPRVRQSVAPQPDLNGTETILLVEDDERVRAAVKRILRRRGYQLLIASNGADAIELARMHEGTIDLVLSDVVMPGTNGLGVAEAVRQSFGDARVLLMSGFTDHALLRDGDLPEQVGFIQKPFSPEALAKKIRELCDA
ncbi:MAG TPA: response regulator [Polyangiaceae bacterium]